MDNGNAYLVIIEGVLRHVGIVKQERQLLRITTRY